MRAAGVWLMVGRVISAAILSLVAALALAGCGSSGPPAPAPTQVKVDVTPTPAKSPWTFAVAGNHPVVPNGSQDTYAATPGAVCDSAEFAKDMFVGQQVAAGFRSAGFPASADLLEHFLQGEGTEVDYRAGSSISNQVLASSAFQALNEQVQGMILGQLKAGQAPVQLSAAQLPTVTFESTTSDLYWGFRGTQGLTVAGSGVRKNGRYAGTLTYVIRDSYGFRLTTPSTASARRCGTCRRCAGHRSTPEVPAGSLTPSR